MRRQITLDGCLNFRDLGGYPTADGRTLRWGLVYRSDGLHLLTERDIAVLRDELGIGDVLDLRSSGEVEIDGRGLLERQPLRFHHLPLFDGDMSAARDPAEKFSLADRYFLLAEFAKKPIGRVIETLAMASGAAVYHCAAGKDRTGVISALLLDLLGVPEEFIVADYALSQQNLEAIMDRLLRAEGYRAMLSNLPPETMHANPETMTAFLGRLRETHGSAREYARSAEVSDVVLERLVARLVS